MAKKNPLEEALDIDQDDTPDEASPRRRSSSAQDIGDKIAAGITEGLSKMAPQRIKPGSSRYDPKSPFRSKHGPRLIGEVYHNGIKLNEEQLYDEEITLCNAITQGGRYVDRLVEVLFSDDAGTRVVMIRYPDKTIDQRMNNKNHWRNFKELLQLIVEGQRSLVTA